MDYTTKPNIPQWFRGRSILVTGGTGFMGKVLLAKLLKSCPDINELYVLIREKRGMSPKSRLAALIQEEPFRILRENHPEKLKKLIPVNGDTTLDGLGISTEEAEIIKNNVSVVINMAANVRFNTPLKTAINMNTRGAKNVITFLKQFKQLDSFVHVSTAYCHCTEPVLEEKYYPMTMTPEEVMKIVEETPEDILEAMTHKILGEQPNTYAFSKGLSEDLVYRSGLPVAIARPSIVLGSWKEPDQGWVDNMNGPVGLMIGAAKGVIRSMLCNKEYCVDVMPCDLVINAIIAVAWKIGVEKPTKPYFINLTEGHENPLTWGCALETGRRHATAHPFSGPLWYPGGGMTSSKILHFLTVFFFQTIPAYILDGLLILTRNKPFLIRVQEKVNYGTSMVYYYTTKQWIFKNDELKALRENLYPEDKNAFFMDIREITWEDFLLNYILAARKYCLKDDPSTLPKARRVFAYLYTIDRAIKIGLALLVAWYIYPWIIPEKMTLGAAHDTVWVS